MLPRVSGRTWGCCVLSLAVALVSLAEEPPQLDRRDRREPAIVLSTGGRTGTCDAIAFSPDGRAVLAVGDDKVVTVIPLQEEKLDNRDVTFLRWPLWREQRGAIYALGISPDGRHVAVGGYGLRNSSVAVIERHSGRITRLVNLEKGRENFFAVMCLAFSPDGRSLAIGTGSGSVWFWDLEKSPELIGRHKPLADTPYNRVRSTHFLGARTIVSVAEDGKVARWEENGASWTGQLAVDLSPEAPIRTAAFNSEGWLAAGELGRTVHVCSPDGKIKHRKTLDVDEFPRCLAFDETNRRLALAVGRLRPGADFRLEADDRLEVIDVTHPSLPVVARLPHTGRAEAVAFHGSKLVVGGGDSHEVTLWDVTAPNRPISVVRGAGSGIWSVRLTREGRHLAFSDRRNPDADHPNRRGFDEWRVFDLRRRRFEKSLPETAELVQPIETLSGWTVKPDPKRPWLWHVVDGSGRSFPLPWNRDTDGRPTCYSFLPAKAESPPRLLVGHYWGFSQFELGPSGPRRVKLFTGHHGEVTSLCPSADGRWLVSSSNDQTIAGWSLNDWPSGTGLGARLSVLPVSVRVDEVSVGSPAWEMGLIPGDEITFIALAGREFFGPGLSATSVDAKTALDSARPGDEIFLEVRRPGRDSPVRTLTTMRQRPLWRFFPATDREWVMWTWHGNFYDTSTNGDSLVGWVMNDPSMSREPRFFRLEQFRDAFQREDVIEELLDTLDIGKALALALGSNPVAVNLGLNEPPSTRIEVDSSTGAEGLTCRLVATARGDHVDFLPQRVEFWINDYRHRVWEPRGQAFTETVTLKAKDLRSGANRLILQAFNRLGGRSDAVVQITRPAADRPGRLLGLGIGINDYGLQPAIGGRRKLGNLQGAVQDVEMHASRWQSQGGRLFSEATFTLRSNQQARRSTILSELDHLADTAQPDDLLIVVLAGHGDFRTIPADKPRKSDSRFYFCCPDYDPRRPDETGIVHAELYNKLAALRCRKIVFLDACHSGEAAFNPVRSLTPGGVGPIIYAACDRSELAYEHPTKKNGLFTLAALHALGEGFPDSDRDGDGQIDTRELIDSIRRKIPDLLRETGRADDLQNPQCFPRQPDRFPLFRP